MKTLSTLFKLHLRLVYFFMKMQSTKKKVSFLSWQADASSVDFSMLKEYLNEHQPDIETVMLTKRMKKSVGGAIGYYFHMYKQMYHIASSAVVVLDSYVPIVSILNHKDDLYVIQLWHALGAIKKFGMQTVGKPGGRSSKQAGYFNMHENYSLIISSSKKTSAHYSEAFGYPTSVMKECGLPRIDYLKNNNESIRARILDQYPQLSETKKNILYAPTFRNDNEHKSRELIDTIDFSRYNLIIKPHKRQESLYMDDPRIISPKDFSSMELLTVTDFLITDYSAISLEAAVLDVKTLFYLYDYEKYSLENGLNVDIYDILKECVFEEPNQLPKLLENSSGENHILREDYLPKELGQSTECIASIIIDKVEETDR